jgi:hypothetical protein
MTFDCNFGFFFKLFLIYPPIMKHAQSQSGSLLIYITGFVTRVTRRVAQELLRPFWSTWVYSQCLLGLVWLTFSLAKRCFNNIAAISIIAVIFTSGGHQSALNNGTDRHDQIETLF